MLILGRCRISIIGRSHRPRANGGPALWTEKIKRSPLGFVLGPHLIPLTPSISSRKVLVLKHPCLDLGPQVLVLVLGPQVLANTFGPSTVQKPGTSSAANI